MHRSGLADPEGPDVRIWVTTRSATLAQCPVCPKADMAGRFMSTCPSHLERKFAAL